MAQPPADSELAQVAALSKAAAEYDMLQTMSQARRAGRSFTAWLHEFNGGRGEDTSHDGASLSGRRNFRGSKLPCLWEEAASATYHADLMPPPYSRDEVAYLDTVLLDFELAPPRRDHSVISLAQRRAFLWAPAEEQVE